MGSLRNGRFDRLKELAGKTIVHYSARIREQHQRFISRAWPKSTSRKDPVYLAWKFRSNSTDEIENLLLAIDQGNVVGQLGLIPVQVKIGNRILEAQWGCNFKVLSELEGAGYGSLLDIRSLGKKTITLGAAPTKQSEDIKIRLGFTALEGPRIMAFPIDFRYFIQLKLAYLPLVIIKALETTIKPIYKLRYFKSYRLSKKLQDGILHGSYKDIIHLIESSRAKIQIAQVVHNTEFLHWRCKEVAGYRKEALSLRTPSGSFILYYPTSGYCYLYEYWFANPADRISLLKELLLIASDFPSKGLYSYINDPRDENDFKTFGFFGFRTKIKVYAFAEDSAILFGKYFHMNIYDSDGNL